MKKLLVFAIAVVALSVNAFAATEVNVVVDKTPVEQKGVIVENRTLVPVRGVFEKMGYTAEYDAETKTATLKKGSDVLKFTAGENYFTYNDKKIETEVPQQIIEGRFMLPLRAIESVEFVGIKWDGETKTASITHPFSVVPITVEEADKMLSGDATDINLDWFREPIFDSFFFVEKSIDFFFKIAYNIIATKI